MSNQPGKDSLDLFQIFALGLPRVVVIIGLIALLGLPSIQLATNLILVAVIVFGIQICRQLSVLCRACRGPERHRSLDLDRSVSRRPLRRRRCLHRLGRFGQVLCRSVHRRG